jgi:hypothetical protein
MAKVGRVELPPAVLETAVLPDCATPRSINFSGYPMQPLYATHHLSYADRSDASVPDVL